MITKISVAIVTRNRSNLLHKCLKSLTKQTISPFEVLVIDNSSTDDTKQVVLSFRKTLPIRYIAERTIGVASVRNRALEKAYGDILAFIDDDCEATPAWAEEMAKAHSKYPKAAAIQGKSLVLNKKSIFGILAHKYKNDWTDKNIINKNYLKIFETQNSSFKRNLIKSLGLSFDNSISQRFYYGEDPDFSAQLEKFKQKIMYYPKAEVFFRSRTNLFSFLKQRFLIGRANRFLSYEWPDLYTFQSKTIDPTKNLLPMNSYLRLIYSFVAHISKLTYHLGAITEAIFLYMNFSRLYTSSNLHETNKQIEKDTTRFSVMIITKDRPKLLRRCLQSLVNQKRIPNEVIIVDSSKERVYSIIQEFKKYLPVKYIYEERLGFGVARNTALENATGDIIATIDDDEEAVPDWSMEIIAAHRRFPDAVAIQGRLMCKPTSLYAMVEQIRLDRWFLNSLKYDNTTWALSTKNVSFKTALLRRFHLRFTLDPLYAKLGDDVDFGNQIIAKNLTIVYVSSIVVRHTERSNILKYLKQQYRKGKSRALIKRDWKEIEEKKRIYSIPRFSHIVDVFIHPLRKKTILMTPFLFLTYVLSIYFYNKGLRDFTRLLRDNSTLYFQSEAVNTSFKQKATSFTVAIITRNRARSLHRALLSLTKQTLFPTSVLVVDNASSDNTKNVVDSFKKNLPIRYVYETKIGIPFARNRALHETNNKILAFMDDDCEADSLWVEKMIESHKKYPQITAILGRIENLPRSGIFATVVRFNYQTWLRDNLIGDRHLYWDLINGKIEKDLEILICDTKNLSLKMDHIRKFHLVFNEELEHGSDSDFGKKILSDDLHILFYPKARIYHREREKLKDFLQQSFYQGKTYNKLKTQWPSEYFFSSKRRTFPRKVASFIYFCLANKYYLKLPVLVGVFLIHHKSRQEGMSSLSL